MASVVATSGVKLKSSTGALSGSTTLTGIDDNNVSHSLATITATGVPTKGGKTLYAGINHQWALYVTYNSNGTATGSAAGSWSGITETDVPVQVDAPGHSHHHKKKVTKKKTKAKSSSKRPVKKKKTTKASKSRSTARRTKAPARKARRGRR